MTERRRGGGDTGNYRRESHLHQHVTVASESLRVALPSRATAAHSHVSETAFRSSERATRPTPTCLAVTIATYRYLYEGVSMPCNWGIEGQLWSGYEHQDSRTPKHAHGHARARHALCTFKQTKLIRFQQQSSHPFPSRVSWPRSIFTTNDQREMPARSRSALRHHVNGIHIEQEGGGKCYVL